MEWDGLFCPTWLRGLALVVAEGSAANSTVLSLPRLGENVTHTG